MAKLRKHGPTSRNERRRAAELRQEYYNSLTPQQKLGRLPIKGKSKKEIRRLINHPEEKGGKKNKKTLNRGLTELYFLDIIISSYKL